MPSPKTPKSAPLPPSRLEQLEDLFNDAVRAARYGREDDRREILAHDIEKERAQ